LWHNLYIVSEALVAADENMW